MSPGYRPSTTDRITSSGARSRFVTIAASWSLSPKRISATLTVSFSLMIGIAFHSQELQDRVADVEIPRAIVEIVGRQQKLGGVKAMLPKAGVVRVHEVRLPNGRRRLQGWQDRSDAY